MTSLEPLVHSHREDVLPDEHPLAYTNIHCTQCDVMLHAFNNECMQTWIEAKEGDYCLTCFNKVESQ